MELKKLQDRLLDILCVVDDICKKNDVTYWLTGGTELGAVREKDFIPWDDDADIKVPFDEYLKFREAMKKNLPEHLHLAEPDAFSPYFYDFVVRIYDDRWLLRKETPKDIAYGNLQNRVSVDVFITMGVPDSPVKRFIIIEKMKYLYLLGMSHRYNLDFGKYKGLTRIIVKIFSKYGKLFTIEHIFKKWQKTAENSNKKAGRYVTTANTVVKDLGILEEKTMYNDKTSGIIQGIIFPIPAGYDQELTKRYGDYMTPVRDDNVYTRHID